MRTSQTLKVSEYHTVVVPTVLLVDDEPSVLRTLERWVLKSRRMVVSCSTFEDAKDYLALNTPDVLVTDVRLREYNGLQLVVLVKDRSPAVSCVVLTGHDDPVLRRDAESLHARYLLKPIGQDEFLAAIEAAGGARCARPEPCH